MQEAIIQQLGEQSTNYGQFKNCLFDFFVAGLFEGEEDERKPEPC